MSQPQLQSRSSSFLKRLGLNVKLGQSPNRDPPPAPDGLSNDEAAPESDGKGLDHGWLTNLIEDLEAQFQRGNPVDLSLTQIVCLYPLLKHNCADLCQLRVDLLTQSNMRKRSALTIASWS
jgi:hypothetical protein